MFFFCMLATWKVFWTHQTCKISDWLTMSRRRRLVRATTTEIVPSRIITGIEMSVDLPAPVRLIQKTSCPSKILAGHSAWNLSSSKPNTGGAFSLIFPMPLGVNHGLACRVDQSKGGGMVMPKGGATPAMVVDVYRAFFALWPPRAVTQMGKTRPTPLSDRVVWSRIGPTWHFRSLKWTNRQRAPIRKQTSDQDISWGTKVQVNWSTLPQGDYPAPASNSFTGRRSPGFRVEPLLCNVLVVVSPRQTSIHMMNK